MMLHTRKRDGSWIGTPVNVAVDGDRAYFGKPAIAAKVKRLRNFADVAIAPSTPRGTPTGSFVGARARLLRGDEAIAASRLLRRKYRFVHSILVPLELRIRRTKGLFYELTDIRAADHESLRGAGAGFIGEPLHLMVWGVTASWHSTQSAAPPQPSATRRVTPRIA
jgi:PPOX class probable F420-dependent enzyme